jgi:hypothetical protein
LLRIIAAHASHYLRSKDFVTGVCKVLLHMHMRIKAFWTAVLRMCITT